MDANAGSGATSRVPLWAWLLIAFGVCGVTLPCMAAIAIPSLVGYLRSSKTAEADANLDAMAEAVVAFCQQNAHLPSPTGPVPPPPAPGPEKIAVDPANRSFAEIGFTFSEPVYFAYSIRPRRSGSIDLVAEGDLDGDGVRSRYSRRCTGDCRCEALSPVNPTE